MSNKELGIFYDKNWLEIEEYTIKTIKHFKRNLDVSGVIAESYIHLDKEKEKIEGDRMAMSFVKNWIKMNMLWYNSPILLKNKMISGEAEINDNKSYEYTYLNIDINYKKWEDKFYYELPRLKKNIWYIWWHLNLRKGKDISKHLNISISGAYLVIKECKELELSFRDYIKKKLDI
jgi:hypothetical protein